MDPQHFEKLDPDPDQSEKVEASKGHLRIGGSKYEKSQ
jgi:hypothetical protein